MEVNYCQRNRDLRFLTFLFTHVMCKNLQFFNPVDTFHNVMKNSSCRIVVTNLRVEVCVKKKRMKKKKKMTSSNEFIYDSNVKEVLKSIFSGSLSSNAIVYTLHPIPLTISYFQH